MVAEARLAERLGWIGAAKAGRIAGLLAGSACRPPRRGSTLPPCSTRWPCDKKNRAGRVRFVLPGGSATSS